MMLLILIILVLIPAGDVTADAYKDEECLACHQDQRMVRTDAQGELQSLSVDREAWEGDVHRKRGLGCVDCHRGANPFSHPQGGFSSADCTRCHPESQEEHARSIHQLALMIGHPQGPQCYDCHTTHNVRPPTDPLSNLHHRNLKDTCTQCHAEGKGPTGSFDKVSLLRISGHKRSDYWGRLRRDLCLHCHQDDLILKERPNTREYCLSCHRVKAALKNVLFGPFHLPPSFHIQPITYIVFITLFILAIGLYRNFSLWRRGWKEGGQEATREKFLRFLRDALGNKRAFRGDPLGGVMHLLLMWGFSLLLLGHLISRWLSGISALVGNLALDLLGMVFLAGVSIAIIRRYFLKRGEMHNLFQDHIILISLFVIGATGFLLEGGQMAAQQPPFGQTWAPIGGLLAPLFEGDPSSWYRALWFIHIGVIMSVLAYIPYSKLFHIFSSPATILQRPYAPTFLSLDEREGLEGDFSQRQLISVEGCTRCNRCEVVCPAFLVGEPLSPRRFFQEVKGFEREKYGLKAQWRRLFKKPRRDLPKESAVQGNQMWYCTTCRACMEECPVYVNGIDIIREVRIARIEGGTKVPATLTKVLEGVYKYSNPWERPKPKRAEWAQGLGIKDLSQGDKAPLLYYVGCTASYDARLQEVAKALVAVLKGCGVDFVILGDQEPCCGDPVRRLGEDGLFEELVMNNCETFARFEIKDMVTTSPHGLHCFKNEYPPMMKKLGIEGDGLLVRHYTQLMVELIGGGKVSWGKETDLRVTYHDPCYLGRHNGVYEEPRTVLRSIPGITLIEMPRSRDRSLCCGGGGGRMWFEAEEGGRVSELRVREAADVGAEVIATACPFCLSMFTDAVKTTGLEGKLEVKDIMELVQEAMR